MVNIPLFTVFYTSKRWFSRMSSPISSSFQSLLGSLPPFWGHIRRCDAHLKQMTMESASPHKVLKGGGQGKPQINWHKTGGLDWWYGCGKSFENVEIMWFLRGVGSQFFATRNLFFSRLLFWKKWQSRMHQKSFNVIIRSFAGFYTSQVVQDFFHQQYLSTFPQVKSI